ncbi:hypothetical protein L1987_35458 [Smallanthus sonchifolius]|uniref:Uncharacterized protein n=1 Tax=Smallanthus sonchifolius TaxID=185202 RepID=A0ACB9HXU6_9ASTR|nr:hypothetical protein L1987_35458 [Smallanthus sonchifolius]
MGMVTIRPGKLSRSGGFREGDGGGGRWRRRVAGGGRLEVGAMVAGEWRGGGEGAATGSSSGRDGSDDGNRGVAAASGGGGTLEWWRWDVGVAGVGRGGRQRTRRIRDAILEIV